MACRFFGSGRFKGRAGDLMAHRFHRLDATRHKPARLKAWTAVTLITDHERKPFRSRSYFHVFDATDDGTELHGVLLMGASHSGKAPGRARAEPESRRSWRFPKVDGFLWMCPRGGLKCKARLLAG